MNIKKKNRENKGMNERQAIYRISQCASSHPRFVTLMKLMKLWKVLVSGGAVLEEGWWVGRYWTHCCYCCCALLQVYAPPDLLHTPRTCCEAAPRL